MGASAEPHSRMLHGANPGAGRRAGGNRKRMLSDFYSFCPLVHKQEQAGAMQAGAMQAGAHFSTQQHFTLQNHPSFPFAHSHIPFVLPQGRTEELEESSQCTLPTFPSKVSTILWASLCLMQGVTAAEEPTVSSMYPKPGANLPCWPTQP